MERPWTAECAVSEDLARSLIETQFPSLAPTRLASMGEGWDNTAYLVNDEWVFRFPRREIAVGLLETETTLLSAVAPRLPLPVPVPTLLGRPQDRYAWPFAGYRKLAGRTACAARLDDAQRIAAAPAIAGFLRALHAIPPDEARVHGAAPDTLARLDVARRGPQIETRLGDAAERGLVEDPRPWMRIVEDVPAAWTPGGSTLVHGDFDVRHVLVDDDANPVSVIDWGDVHLGDPAVDLSIALGFLPPSARDAFRDAYGEIDDATWRIARFRALSSAVLILVYGRDVGDEDLVREGRRALGHLLIDV